MSVERVSVPELVSRLDALKGSAEHPVIVFDGDGTLWSGDVSEDVFHFAVGRKLLREEPRDELARVARAHGLSEAGSSSELAGRMFEAYAHGEFPERTVFELMTWCYAGHESAELARMAAEALELARLEARLHRSLEAVFELAERRGIRVVIVSASPDFIVELAAAKWNVRVGDIAASRAARQGDRLLPILDGPIPYAETKVVHARRLFGDARWLAAFGDSTSDLPMMLAADLGVAVQPKPALMAELHRVPNAVLLEG